jgi:hypothetical protein
MKIKCLCILLSVFCFSCLPAQEDSLVNDPGEENERLSKMVKLTEVIVRTDINVAKFMERVKNDTSFYKAFRSLHLVGFTSLNDIRIKNKKNKVVASLQSRTMQTRQNNCRSMEVLNETTTGNFYDGDRDYNYYTAELYDGLFFTKGKICGETNIVKGIDFNPKSQKGMEKHKQQLKMLFFNPGKKISGIPLMGDKIDIFDPDRARLYDFLIDYGEYEGQSCYIFSIKARQDLSSGKKDKIVIDSMITWFHSKTMEVLARNYDMSYNAAVYDFNVHMEVQMTRFGKYLLPKTLRYIGSWDVAFKKRERGVFTATLFDFTE